MPPDETEPQAPKSVEDGAVALARTLAVSGSGALAELRRGRPGDGSGAFWRVYHRCRLPQHRGLSEDWEWVAHALAILTSTDEPDAPLGCHAPKGSLGRKLAAAKVGEQRVARLLTMTRAPRRVALVRIFRRLARDNVKLDVGEAARLLIHNRPERTLRRLADDYYGALDAAEHDKEEEAENA